jgi:predicted phosphodiesterase
MELKRRNILWFLFFSINAGLVSVWGIILLWLTKNQILWVPLEFLLYLPIVILLIFIPSYFFIRSTVKLAKNFKIKERFKVSKRYLIPSLFIVFLFWSITIIIVGLYIYPISFDYDDGPYLIWNDDPKTTMTIIWHTKNPTETELEYGESIGDMVPFRISYLDKRHVVELKNLKPGTFYYYKITGFSTQTFNFTTAPSNTIPFNFTAVSDTHRSTKYGDIIDVMNNYTYDFILSAGDVANSEMIAWHAFFDLIEKQATNRPYMIAMGNHEQGGLDVFGRKLRYFFPYNYMESWGNYYSFDYSNAHFVMLDIFQNPLEWSGFLLEAQEAWLRADLAANKGKWIFVGIHEPIYSTGHYNMNEKLMTQLGPIFYENQVSVVFSGHDHHYESFWINRTESWGGTYFFVTGGGGGGLDNSIWKSNIHNSSVELYQNDYWTRNDQIYGELTHEFMHFEVNGNNLHIQAIRDNDTLIQEFFVTK